MTTEEVVDELQLSDDDFDVDEPMMPGSDDEFSDLEDIENDSDDDDTSRTHCSTHPKLDFSHPSQLVSNTYLCEYNTLHFPCWPLGCHSRLTIRHLSADVYPSLLGHHREANQPLCQGGNGRRKVPVMGKGHTGRAEGLPWFLCSHWHQSAPCPR